VKSTFCFLFTLVFLISGFGQTGNDTVSSDTSTKRERVTAPPRPRRAVVRTVVKRAIDTPIIRPDSLISRSKKKVATRPSYAQALRQNPYFNFFGKPILQSTSQRHVNSKDGLFYSLLVLILYFALVRLLFFRYLDNLFTLFFRASLKQKQIREQLLQTPLPSLLLNILFAVIGGIYVSFLLTYYNLFPSIPLPLLMVYSTVALGFIYFCKFITLKFLGWVFSIEEATDMYIFIVFMVNKILAIFLLPFIVLMAFSGPDVLSMLVSLTYLLIALAFIYRYIISFAPIRKQINVSQFHFFLYLCGFEIIPLLVIYKVLLSFFERSF
jgi:hypothetical protein